MLQSELGPDSQVFTTQPPDKPDKSDGSREFSLNRNRLQGVTRGITLAADFGGLIGTSANSATSLNTRAYSIIVESNKYNLSLIRATVVTGRQYRNGVGLNFLSLDAFGKPVETPIRAVWTSSP